MLCAVLLYELGFCTVALQAPGTLPLSIVNLSRLVSAVLITPQGAGAILPARRQQGPSQQWVVFFFFFNKLFRQEFLLVTPSLKPSWAFAQFPASPAIWNKVCPVHAGQASWDLNLFPRTHLKNHFTTLALCQRWWMWCPSLLEIQWVKAQGLSREMQSWQRFKPTSWTISIQTWSWFRLHQATQGLDLNSRFHIWMSFWGVRTGGTLLALSSHLQMFPKAVGCPKVLLEPSDALQPLAPRVWHWCLCRALGRVTYLWTVWGSLRPCGGIGLASAVKLP